MKTDKPDLIVQAEEDTDLFYQIVEIPNRTHACLRQFSRGDAYHRRVFHSNQYGKFLFGYRVKVKRGKINYWSGR